MLMKEPLYIFVLLYIYLMYNSYYSLCWYEHILMKVEVDSPMIYLL